MRDSRSFNGRVDLSPYKLRSDISGRIEPSINIRPEMSKEKFKINFK